MLQYHCPVLKAKQQYLGPVLSSLFAGDDGDGDGDDDDDDDDDDDEDG